MLDISKSYVHAQTGAAINPNVINQLFVLEDYLSRGFASEDYCITGYAEAAYRSLGVKSLDDAIKVCKEQPLADPTR